MNDRTYLPEPASDDGPAVISDDAAIMAASLDAGPPVSGAADLQAKAAAQPSTTASALGAGTAGAPEDKAGPDTGTSARSGCAADVPGDLAEAPGADSRLPGGSAADVPEPVYLALEDWVTGYFLPMFRRALGGEFRWCAQWWQHGEAISRLTSLWHAWEVLRHQPGTGIGAWYRDHLDHQLPLLLGARGPFCQCSESAHREPREAAAVPAPGHWWDTGDDYGDAASGTGAGGYASLAASTGTVGGEPGTGDGHGIA